MKSEGITVPIDADFAPFIEKMDAANERMRAFMEEWRDIFDAALAEYDRRMAEHQAAS